MPEQPPAVHHADVVNVFHYLSPVTINNFYDGQEVRASEEVAVC